MKGNSIFSTNRLSDYLTSMKVKPDLKTDILEGVKKNSMALRLTHHVLRLIDWNNLTKDPIRKQFLPLCSEYLPSHPQSRVDSLSEEKKQLQPGLIHRYPNKILFLIGNYCPTYCAFCTRSYAVGSNTQALRKSYLTKSMSLGDRSAIMINYLKNNINIDDVLISGGDVASVEPLIIDKLLDDLATIKSLRTVRLATRTLLFEPNLFLPNTSLFKIITRQFDKFKQRNMELSIQCHFNHANEISPESQEAAVLLWRSGVIIRNQTVLLDGINSTTELQKNLIERLIRSGIQPYYVYQMDMVANAEHFRTNLETCISISKALTGAFAGFQLPRFIVDLPFGGGKRSVYEYDSHDNKYGVYAFKSPLISGDKTYYYFDPLRYLDPYIQKEWNDKKTISKIYN
jgi:lysine 2,3-aminomutase